MGRCATKSQLPEPYSNGKEEKKWGWVRSTGAFFGVIAVDEN